MLVLALTTSTPRASVALVEDDRVLVKLERDDPRSHAEQLFALIDRALQSAGRARSEIDLVACDVGPGSFTGVRIAVASAKGVAVGLGVPLAGVVSLEAMAAEARSACAPHELVASAIDAKKGELYLAVHDGENVLLPPEHLAREAVASRLREIISDRAFAFVADDSAFDDLAPGAAHTLTLHPGAEWIGRIAARRGGVDPQEIVPLYVRAPDAVPSASYSAADGVAVMLRPR